VLIDSTDNEVDTGTHSVSFVGPRGAAEHVAPHDDVAYWTEVARTALTSRAIDRIEETELLPAGKLRHQFSARGHELVQAIVAAHLRHPRDGAIGYYRSRPFALGVGLTAREAFAGSLGLANSRTAGRDVGVVLHLRARRGVTLLPASGDVGGQYTPAAGWAEAIVHRATVLRERAWERAIAVAMGGDGSVAANGFWSALTLATTLPLPMVIVIEDNGLGISTPSTRQTPGGNIAANLRSFSNLRVLAGDGVDPAGCSALVAEAVGHAREERRPVLLRLTVPRLCGHSGLDDGGYPKHGAPGVDPIVALEEFVTSHDLMSRATWNALVAEVERDVRFQLEEALADEAPDPRTVAMHVVSKRPPPPHEVEGGHNDGEPTTMKDAIRRALGERLEREPFALLLGEDIGAKGGVHGVTAGLEQRFGAARVVDTSLSEEGIVGRAIGLSLAGLAPVAEIQFRKYLDPATEQLHNCGTIRWRTSGEFSAPMVVRIPVGHHTRISDPWHAVSDEASLARMLGWRIAFPSNARDAVGLLRTALRGEDPTFFLEHRNLLVRTQSRAPYPAPGFLLPFGEAATVRAGERVTLVTWGDMVYRALEAADRFDAGTVEVIDLRTIAPWDVETVVRSVERTGRCLVVHEDTLTLGFGAEIAACIGREAFLGLEAPVDRLAVADHPMPYHRALVDAALPSVDEIARRLRALLEY